MDAISVLVVDDEPGIRDLFRDTLTRKGYEVLTAGDGESAIALAKRKNPSIAFVDIRMPGIDGVGLIRRLQSESLCSHFVMITGHGRDERVVAAMHMGAFACLMKPFSVRDIIGMTEVVLSAT